MLQAIKANFWPCLLIFSLHWCTFLFMWSVSFMFILKSFVLGMFFPDVSSNVYTFTSYARGADSSRSALKGIFFLVFFTSLFVIIDVTFVASCLKKIVLSLCRVVVDNWLIETDLKSFWQPLISLCFSFFSEDLK